MFSLNVNVQVDVYSLGGCEVRWVLILAVIAACDGIILGICIGIDTLTVLVITCCCRRPRAQPRPGGGPAADRLLPRPRQGAAAARARRLHRQPRPHQPGLLRG